jgi:serine/threonine protein kinase
MGSYAGRGYGPAADMWSVGVISYMVLCGQAPFDGNSDTERLSAVRKGVFAYPPQASLSKDAVSFINGAEYPRPPPPPAVLAPRHSFWLPRCDSARSSATFAIPWCDIPW